MSEVEQQRVIAEYIEKSRFATLTYVREDLAPVSRTMGSFAADEFNLYFSTQDTAAKVKQIASHPRTSFFFEHDGQAPTEWRSVLLIGDAVVTSGEDRLRGIALLSARNPRFRERAERNDLAGTLVYKLIGAEIEFVDRTQGPAPAQRLLLNKA